MTNTVERLRYLWQILFVCVFTIWMKRTLVRDLTLLFTLFFPCWHKMRRWRKSKRWWCTKTKTYKCVLGSNYQKKFTMWPIKKVRLCVEGLILGVGILIFMCCVMNIMCIQFNANNLINELGWDTSKHPFKVFKDWNPEFYTKNGRFILNFLFIFTKIWNELGIQGSRQLDS